MLSILIGEHAVRGLWVTEKTAQRETTGRRLHSLNWNEIFSSRSWIRKGEPAIHDMEVLPERVSINTSIPPVQGINYD
jgi:hypothetical protein